MIVDLQSVFNVDGESKDIDCTFPLDEEEFVTDVRVIGSVVNKTGIVHLDCRARFDYSTYCALCLKPLLRHATVPVKHILVTHLDSEDDADSFIVVDNMRLDVEQLVAEDIYLSLPSKFLCKEDCRGLCPECGADLNEGSCGCKKPIDPRWSALSELLNE